MQYPRKSRMLERMRRGEKVISFKLNCSCPRLAEMVGLNGFDAVWICQEHVPTDHSTMEAQIMAAKAHDMDCIVRVAKGSYSDYIRPLEADASAIMIPHLMSLEEAREIAYTVRFQPIGRRPVDGGNADGLYCQFEFKEYIEFDLSIEEVVATTEIKSVKVVKDDVKEVGKDRECGIKTTFDDILTGDIIECYSLKRIEE